ncbi:MAG: adenylyltransferase/cytidyltransferase family protein [Patescibacteria group bacterium]|jgi:rfaE bifunctional protein nucleotidyltransferase chain/domain
MKTDKKVLTYSQLKTATSKHKAEGNKIVLTTGCYDILHLGHIIHFSYCKSRGDILVVSVGSDATVRSLKGPNRPINKETFRARMVAALECVDYVVISTELGKMDHNELVALIKPDIYVVPATDSMLEEKKALIESNGGKFVACHRLPPNHLKDGISTTSLAKTLNIE